MVSRLDTTGIIVSLVAILSWVVACFVARSASSFFPEVCPPLFGGPYSVLLCIDPSSQSYGFSSSHVWMWGLDCQESWAPKNWCFWTVVLEKTLESPLDSKEIQPVHPKGSQCWILIGRTDAEAETPILWPADEKNWLTEKDADAGQDWRREKGATENEMVGWHHRLNGHEFEQAPGVGNGQGSLVYCTPWGPKESDMTEQLNWAKLTVYYCHCSRFPTASNSSRISSIFFYLLRSCS